MHKESEQILQQLQLVIHGKKQVLQNVWLTFLAGGHVLLEDLPGVGKTTLAKAFSKVLSLEDKRLQLTPDTVASDITGYMLFNQQQQTFTLKTGVVMTNILLADELNRTSSRTQAALLEAMQEKQVTVDNTTYTLPKPFHVIATQNPTGSVGTQPLPLAQLDRFMTRLSLGYPSFDAHINMLRAQLQETKAEITPVATKEQLLKWQEQVQQVTIHDSLLSYVTTIAETTRTHPKIEFGISPRGAVALCQFARARAFYFGRSFVTPEDIYESVAIVCAHRIVTFSNNNAEEIIHEILTSVPTPDSAFARK